MSSTRTSRSVSSSTRRARVEDRVGRIGDVRGGEDRVRRIALEEQRLVGRGHARRRQASRRSSAGGRGAVALADARRAHGRGCAPTADQPHQRRFGALVAVHAARRQPVVAGAARRVGDRTRGRCAQEPRVGALHRRDGSARRRSPRAPPRRRGGAAVASIGCWSKRGGVPPRAHQPLPTGEKWPPGAVWVAISQSRTWRPTSSIGRSPRACAGDDQRAGAARSRRSATGSGHGQPRRSAATANASRAGREGRRYAPAASRPARRGHAASQAEDDRGDGADARAARACPGGRARRARAACAANAGSGAAAIVSPSASIARPWLSSEPGAADPRAVDVAEVAEPSGVRRRRPPRGSAGSATRCSATAGQPRTRACSRSTWSARATSSVQ